MPAFVAGNENKVGFAEINTAYSLQDRIVFVAQWVDCLFGCFT